jgi:hypothetical protein
MADHRGLMEAEDALAIALAEEKEAAATLIR